MIEKRFTLDYEDIDFIGIDEWENGKRINTYSIYNGRWKERELMAIVDTLNELFEKNKQLQYLEDKYHEENLQLKNENIVLKSENLALKKYIKENYISSVCDTCEHCIDTMSNNYFGVDYDIECKKGHEDMDISDCADYKLMLEVFK